ncbi:hypothetical protein BU23DRAFT_94079 [Bimuria novae-zelandiae CBS 107.79]|uniref:F-box domain-containing protein n=1 Tax=Bimuria novae-zelandiae CBS 107.79 TaxID=1447943 RepID=A0A6A5VBF8_9PLEO|nr:hypothetical protein BU23DRAFT_94079 [Bimuria novae-zelandiae CBS 107.79]
MQLLDLPDELLVLIFSKLHAVRLDKPQTRAFKNKQKERNRQYENYHRRNALYALCLTSQRLNRLAVPVLYSSITGSTTWYGLTTLRLFWKTITGNEELCSHLEYVENLLSDCFGNDLHLDVENNGDDALHLVNEYVEKLADVILIAPNIRKISVVSLEIENCSLWERLLQFVPENGHFPLVPGHSLLKLERLTFQTNAKAGDCIGFEEILCGLIELPLLTEIRALGATGRSVQVPHVGLTLKNLQRIELTECTLGHKVVNDVLIVCDNLRHFICHWSILWCEMSHETPDLLPNLLKHQQTLETLWLLADRADFWSNNATSPACFILHEMRSLKEAKICDSFIPYYRFGNISPMSVPRKSISQLLPSTIEHLTITYTMRYINSTASSFFAERALYRLADDCPHYLPHLRELVIQHESFEIPYSTQVEEEIPLPLKFADKGVRFSVLEESDCLASLD